MALTLIENFRALFYAPFYAAFAFDAFKAEGVRVVLQTSAAWFRYATFEAMTSNDQDLPLCSTYGCPAYSMIPPYVARMFGRGYKIVQIPGTALSRLNAQEAINSTLREVQS